MSHQVAASSSAQSEREQQLQQQQQHTVLYNRAPPPSFPAGGSNLGDQGVPGFNSLPLTGKVTLFILLTNQGEQNELDNYVPSFPPIFSVACHFFVIWFIWICVKIALSGRFSKKISALILANTGT